MSKKTVEEKLPMWSPTYWYEAAFGVRPKGPAQKARAAKGMRLKRKK